MTERWVPLSARGRTQGAVETLYEGVPNHMRNSLMEWINMMMFSSDIIRNDILLEFERRTKTAMQYRADPESRFGAILVRCERGDEFTLDLVDFLVRFAIRSDDERTVLALILAQSGSAWKVVTENLEVETGILGKIPQKRSKLERRVSEHAVMAAQQVIDSSGRPGEHLRTAWGLIYGRQPDPNGAFLEAVKAVEAAAVPVISPNNKKATLGTMLGELKVKLRINLS